MKYLAHLKLPQQCNELLDVYRAEIAPYITELPGSGSHITLFSGRFDLEHESNLISELKHIKSSSFSLSLEDTFDIYDRNRLVLKVRPSIPLHLLHLDIIEHMQSYLNWTEIPAIPPLYASDTQRRKVYEQYGSPYVERFYSPHLSLCSITPTCRTLPVPERLARYSWSVDSFFLYRKNTRWEEVERFELSGE